ncbi:MAG: tRNA-dihydrouridine synthase C [Tenericutes bacterium ADurb.Bin087]|nr:MAG: tRNA-dihydrouridine synthase C [Tenericutes bacterium ADurb.Bin087]
MWKIANTEINGKTILAPMAGITTFAYREFMRSFGVALCYTEMISDSGLIFNNEKTYEYLPRREEKRPTTIQLFGGEKEKLLSAIEKIEKYTDNYDFLDLNLGCPVPKVTRNNGGSAWLKHPNELISMVEAVVKASTKPVTVKIRIGWDEKHINFKELLPKLEAVGVSLIAIHLRTTKQLYGGKARYDLAYNIQDLVSIPLVVSGDIYSLDDALKALEITGAKAVMLARGQLGNPFLAAQIETYFKNGERLPDPTLHEQLDYLWTLANMMVKEKGEHTGILVMRGIAHHFIKGFSFTKTFRVKLTKMSTLANLAAIIKEIKDQALLT